MGTWESDENGCVQRTRRGGEASGFKEKIRRKENGSKVDIRILVTR